jgi:hypothetical protein
VRSQARLARKRPGRSALASRKLGYGGCALMSLPCEMATDAMSVNARAPEIGGGPAGTERLATFQIRAHLGGAETVAPPAGTCGEGPSVTAVIEVSARDMVA